MPDKKEPTFFCEPFQVTRNPVHYVALFDDATNDQVAGEASHGYLSNPSSPATIRAFLPDARFIVVFRNPADRALAMYSYMLENGYEVLSPFERALAAEDRRFRREHFRRTSPHNFWNFMYFRSGLFGEQMARYLDLYPPSSFYLTTLHRLVADPKGVVGEIHGFLGVAHLPPDHLPTAGASKGVRSIPVQYVERTVLRRLARRGVPGAGQVHRRLSTWNRGRPPTMAPGTRERLLERFRPDLDLLDRLTGCDVLGDEVAHSSRQRRVGEVDAASHNTMMR